MRYAKVRTKHEFWQVHLLFLLCFCFALTSVPLAFASFTNEWGEYQDNGDRRGFVADESSQFPTAGTFTTIADGSYFQPLIFDADADGTKEIIGSDGNYLKIWYVNAGTLTLKDELDMGGAQSVMMTALPPGFDADDFQEFVAIFGWTNVTVIEYNGTSINIEQWNTTHNATTGITCVNNSYMPATCFWGTNTNNVSEFLPSTGEIDYIPIGGVGGDNLTSNRGRMMSPPITDFDGDGNYEIALICDHENDNKEDVMIVDVDTNAVDATFSTDGVYELPDTIQYVVVDGLSFFNIDADLDDMDTCYDNCKALYADWWLALTGYASLVSCFATCDYSIGVGSYGGGRSELFITWHTRGGGLGDDDEFLYAIKNNGNDTWTATVYDDASDPGDSYGAPPIIVPQVNGASTDSVCAALTYTSASGNRNMLKCYTEAGVLFFSNTSIGMGGYNYAHPASYAEGTAGTIYALPSFAAARMNGVTSDDYDFIMGAAIISTEGNLTAQLNISGGNAQSYQGYATALGDVNNDGLLDVCGQTSGGVFCAFSPYTNQPPTVYNNYTNGGFGYDFNNPVCLNTTVNFQAQECGGSITNCNYDNDLDEDVERIVSNCGQTATGGVSGSYTTNLQYGDYAGVNPLFNCYYNVTGTFSVRLFMQDVPNNNTEASFNTQPFTVQVINGVAGVTCNLDPVAVLPGDVDNYVGNATAAVGDDVFDTVWDEIGITSTTSKTIIGLAVVIGVMIMIGQIILSPFAIAAGGLIALIMVSFMGLISAYILVLVLISLVLMYFVLGKVISPSQG